MNVVKKALCFVENGQPAQKEVDYALLAMRIAIGLFFISFGFGKLFGAPGLEMFTGMLSGLGFPMAGLFALLVGIAEFFGGIAILLGVFTRFSAFWLTIISLVAWVTVKSVSFGFQAEGNVDLLALGLTVGLFFAGPGMLSVSGMMKKDSAGM